jgi:hypothetical protein
MHTRRGNGRGFDRMAIRPIPRHCPTIAMGAFIMMLGTHDTRHAIRAFTARANGPVVTVAWRGNPHRSRLEMKRGRNFSDPSTVFRSICQNQFAELYLRLTGFACAFSAGSGSLSNSTILVARDRNAASCATAYSLASLFNRAKR